MYIPLVTKSTPIVGSPVSMSLENSRRANMKLILYLIPCLAGRLYGRDRANSRGSSASLLNVRSISFMRHGYRKLEGYITKFSRVLNALRCSCFLLSRKPLGKLTRKRSLLGNEFFPFFFCWFLPFVHVHFRSCQIVSVLDSRSVTLRKTLSRVWIEKKNRPKYTIHTTLKQVEPPLLQVQ